MITLEMAGDMLDQIAEELPSAFFTELNGGIRLDPGERLHPESSDAPLYTLGEYHVDALGRYIILYYGSFARLFCHCTPESFRHKLKETLLHEFTHHLESLGGERELEKQDERDMEQYRRSWGQSS